MTKKSERIELDEAERCASIIETYRSFISKTAIAPDIMYRWSPAKIPQQHDDLVKWCTDYHHLESCAHLIRRQLMLYIPAPRMFALQQHPVRFEWLSVRDYL